MTRLFASLVLLVIAAGCAVKSSYLRPEWETADRTALKRVGVIVRAPAAPAELAGRLARRYVNMHRDFIVLWNAKAGAADGRRLPAVDGVLVLDFVRLAPTGGGDIDAALVAELRRCDDGALVWRVEAERSGGAADEDLSKLTARYERELGPAAKPYVAPLFILLKRAFASLPSPVLTDADVEEKILLDE